MSTANKKLTLQTLFFTHDVITSSNYVYLSLQTHQLSVISAVIGNRFTIVKLHGLCTCHVNKHLSRQGKQLKNTISKEESRVVPNEKLFTFTASKNRTLE